MLNITTTRKSPQWTRAVATFSKALTTLFEYNHLELGEKQRQLIDTVTAHMLRKILDGLYDDDDVAGPVVIPAPPSIGLRLMVPGRETIQVPFPRYPVALSPEARGVFSILYPTSRLPDVIVSVADTGHDRKRRRTQEEKRECIVRHKPPAARSVQSSPRPRKPVYMQTNQQSRSLSGQSMRQLRRKM